MKNIIQAICIFIGASVAATGITIFLLATSMWFWVVVIAITLICKL